MGGIYRVYVVNDIFFYKYMIRNAVWAVLKGNPPSYLTGILIELIYLHCNIVQICISRFPKVVNKELYRQRKKSPSKI